MLLPHLQNTVHVSYQLIGGARTRRGWSCGRRFNFRHHEAPVDADSRRALQTQRRRGPLRNHATRRATCRRCGCGSAGTMRDVHDRRARRFTRWFIGSNRARLRTTKAISGVPGFFRSISASEGTATLIGSTEAWEIIDVLSPAQALAAERERRAPLARAGRAGSARRRRRGIGFRGRSIRHHARPAARKKRRARTPRATKCARSSPAIIGSPIGAATP